MCKSILKRSSLTCFKSLLLLRNNQEQISIVLVVTKVGTDYCNLHLKTTEEEQEKNRLQACKYNGYSYRNVPLSPKLKPTSHLPPLQP